LLAPDPQTRRLALAATVFYIAHHILVKTNLYLVGGVAAHLSGSFQLARLGGLASRTPWLAALFLIPALSLAGVPPLSGFWAKLTVIQAGLEAEEYTAIAVAVLAGLLTLLSMIKIWNEVFWKPEPEDPKPSGRRLLPLVFPIVLLATGTLLIGLNPEPLYALATRTADQLLDPAAYLQAVMGGNP
jgi:multicomponent Na+:H+ antiporter subunit D